MKFFIKVPKYLEWVFECSKKHSEKKLAQKNTQQIKSTFLSPQIIAQQGDTAFFELSNKPLGAFLHFLSVFFFERLLSVFLSTQKNTSESYSDLSLELYQTKPSLSLT